MQDNWQEFDRQFKSVLQDAEEKVPRRVWRAVSARLGSAAPAAMWWRWAVPAFAAAAIAAGLFLSGTFDRKTTGPGDVQILADSAPVNTPAVPEALPAEGTPEEATPSGDVHGAMSVRRAVSSGSMPAGELTASADAVPEAVPESAPSAAEDITGAAPSAPDKNVADPSAPGKTEAPSASGKDNAEIAAQWARIALEESAAAHGGIKMNGLYAQGGLGGNDSNLSYGGTGISRMAPGTGSADAGISEGGPSTYGVPFTVGLGLRFRVADKLSLGTGLDYSLLTRSFKGSYNGAGNYEGTIFHNVQYVGVPVNVYYDLIAPADGSFGIYAKAGGSADLCVSNRYRLQDASYTVVPDKAGGLQFSAMLGLGAEFKLSDKLGLYIDPSVRYYFHGGNQPKSVRTDKPFMFNFDAGLRFNF